MGVVPAIKSAAEQTKTNVIALIATPATARSSYVADLINKFAQNLKVLRVGCPGLEDIIEKGELESERTSQLLNTYILPLKEKGIDQLVLGCTHYPFLKEKIVTILGPTVTLVDSGRSVARRVKALLNEHNLKTSASNSLNRFFTNKDADDFSRVASNLLGRQVTANFVSI